MEFRNEPDPDRPGQGRYVLDDGGKLAARTEWEDRHDRLFFHHTEVDDAYEGQGLAGTLVRQALDDVRRQGRLIVPLCAYVRGWIERHHDYDDLVDHDMLALYLRQ
jgi:predicted GNAT family acetyltransferase